MPDCPLIDSEVPATHQRFFSQSAEEPIKNTPEALAAGVLFFDGIVLFDEIGDQVIEADLDGFERIDQATILFDDKPFGAAFFRGG